MKVKVLPWMICALVALFVVPALANGDSHAARENVDAAFVVFDNGFHEDGRPLDDNTVNITPGGRVTFSYPVGFSVHNADFEETPPTSCVQTAAGAGSTIEPAPPLPPASKARAGKAPACSRPRASTTSSASRIRT